MPRYFAFLRAINVGGHVVKMDRLRRIFESLGFAGVETFIASGNVIFDSPARSGKALETRIENGLLDALGYEVATFIRTERELVEIANYQQFPPADFAAATAFNIVFLGDTLDDISTQRSMALRTEIDDLHVNGREIYRLCQKKQSESTLSNAVFHKVLRIPGAVRGVNTVKRMAAQYCNSKKCLLA